jgi:hypothetical protein
MAEALPVLDGFRLLLLLPLMALRHMSWYVHHELSVSVLSSKIVTVSVGSWVLFCIILW